MNPVNYLGCRVAARLVPSSHPELVAPSFELKLQYDGADKPIYVQGVHLTRDAQLLVDSGQVKGISVDLVMANSVTARILKNARALVTGVRLQDGRAVCVIPRRVQRTRRLGLLFAVGVCAAGFAALICGAPLAGAAALAVGTHAVRTFAEMPSLAFPDVNVLK
jgi:hypothetical protein